MKFALSETPKTGFLATGPLSYLRDGNGPSFGCKKIISILPTAVISSAVHLTLEIILAILVSEIATAISLYNYI